jgi:hypothetical protein
MTELQIGLIGLGATAVVGVFGYNKWQEYRHRKVAESVLKPDHDDVLLSDEPPKAAVKPAEVVERNEPEIRVAAPVRPVERAEPVLAESAYVDPPDTIVEEHTAGIDDSSFAADQIFEPVPVFHPEIETDSPEISAGQVPVDLLDPRLEFVVAMELVESIPVMQILHSQRDVLQRLNKPVHWVGFNERNREWERLLPDSNQSIRRLRIGLQLVNRLGPVSPSDVAIFGNAVQALADELMAVADMPPSRVLDQATELDQFCAAVDLEIGVNLVSRAGAFAGTKIRALAEAAGMVLGSNGLFTRYDDAGRVQFSLQNYETTPFSAEALRTMTTHGLTFLLDVPRVDHGERVFMQMTELAKRFAETLQGVLVDDNRQPLSDAQLDHIRREFIGKPQVTMAEYGIPAGSPQAQRLFS